MASFQSYAVNYFVVGFAERQLATVSTERKQTELINFIEDNGGVLEGEWYKFTKVENIRATIKKTRELGGIVYDLPVRTGP